MAERKKRETTETLAAVAGIFDWRQFEEFVQQLYSDKDKVIIKRNFKPVFVKEVVR